MNGNKVISPICALGSWFVVPHVIFVPVIIFTQSYLFHNSFNAGVSNSPPTTYGTIVSSLSCPDPSSSGPKVNWVWDPWFNVSSFFNKILSCIPLIIGFFVPGDSMANNDWIDYKISGWYMLLVHVQLSRSWKISFDCYSSVRDEFIPQQWVFLPYHCTLQKSTLPRSL